jgi:hypothetical protein
VVDSLKTELHIQVLDGGRDASRLIPCGNDDGKKMKRFARYR